MANMSLGAPGLVMAILGVSPASASENMTCLKDVAAAWSHWMVTDPGVVMVGALAEMLC